MYCYISEVCVTNKTSFGFDDRIYWTFIQQVTTVHKSLSDTLSSSSDWTLSTSDHTSLLHYSVVLRPVFWLCPLTENTIFSCQECVFLGPLPSNECLSIVERVCFGNVFTEPLPSNGHMSHSITLTSRPVRCVKAYRKHFGKYSPFIQFWQF
jgi:hypothetical protein